MSPVRRSRTENRRMVVRSILRRSWGMFSSMRSVGWTCILSGGFSKIVFFKQVASCMKNPSPVMVSSITFCVRLKLQAFLLRQYPFCCVFLARSIPQEGGSENKGNLSRRVFRPPTLLNCEPQVSPVLIEELACISRFRFREFQQFSAEECK